MAEPTRMIDRAIAASDALIGTATLIQNYHNCGWIGATKRMEKLLRRLDKRRKERYGAAEGGAELRDEINENGTAWLQNEWEKARNEGDVGTALALTEMMYVDFYNCGLHEAVEKMAIDLKKAREMFRKSLSWPQRWIAW